MSPNDTKDNSPERRASSPAKSNKHAANADNYDDEPDETLGERLMGLTEMFPEPLRKFTGNVAEFTWGSAKTIYKFTRNTAWIFFTSSVILFSPIILETERTQLAELQHTHQKQVLLGVGSAPNKGPTRQ